MSKDNESADKDLSRQWAELEEIEQVNSEILSNSNSDLDEMPERIATLSEKITQKKSSHNPELEQEIKEDEEFLVELREQVEQLKEEIEARQRSKTIIDAKKERLKELLQKPQNKRANIIIPESTSIIDLKRLKEGIESRLKQDSALPKRLALEEILQKAVSCINFKKEGKPLGDISCTLLKSEYEYLTSLDEVKSFLICVEIDNLYTEAKKNTDKLLAKGEIYPKYNGDMKMLNVLHSKITKGEITPSEAKRELGAIKVALYEDHPKHKSGGHKIKDNSVAESGKHLLSMFGMHRDRKEQKHGQIKRAESDEAATVTAENSSDKPKSRTRRSR